MITLRHPQRADQINSIWGSIWSTPPGLYNPFRVNSLYIKNIRVGVCQEDGKVGARNREDCPGHAYDPVMLLEKSLRRIPSIMSTRFLRNLFICNHLIFCKFYPIIMGGISRICGIYPPKKRANWDTESHYWLENSIKWDALKTAL